MNALEIRRVPIAVELTTYKPLQSELFDKCRDLLGYDVSDVTATEHNSATLNGILKKAGVDPLSLNDVHRYQKSMVRKMERFYLRTAIHVFVALTGLAIWGNATNWKFNVFHEEHDAVEIVMGYFFPLLMYGVVVGVGASLAIWGPGKSWEWRSAKLKGYAKPVPEFALSQALSIQRVNSNVSFEVEELQAEEKVADPFLKVVFGNRTSYIAVWDEPKFEGRVTRRT